MFFVTRVDSLRTIAAEEVNVELQARMIFEDRHAVFLGTAGIDGGFVNDDVALLQHLADGLAGLDERGEVWPLVFVDGGGDGDDIAVTGAQIINLGGVTEILSRSQIFCGGFKCVIVTSLELVDSAVVDVKTDDRAFTPKFDSEWQAHIAEANDSDF